MSAVTKGIVSTEPTCVTVWARDLSFLDVWSNCVTSLNNQKEVHHFWNCVTVWRFVTQFKCAWEYALRSAITSKSYYCAIEERIEFQVPRNPREAANTRK